MQNTFDIIGEPNYGYPQPQQYQQPQYYNYAAPQKPAEPEIKVDIGTGLNFTTVKDNETSNTKMVVHSDSLIDTTPAKKSRKKSNNNQVTDIVKAPEDQAIVEDLPTINTYLETAGMIKQSMDQIDTVMIDLKREFDEVRNSRTMKNKYNTIVGLAGNMANLAEARISAIKELNNCISKSNDMDYKRLKDKRDAMAGAGTGDEKAVMDFYRAIVADPNLVLGQPGQRVPDNIVQQVQSQMIPPQGVGNVASGIVRAPEDNGAQMAGLTQDTGYINYMANMPASMGNILMEQNPDIQECVVFDASTGGKWFQVMNTKTGQPIPNMQITDQMFMEDTVLNPKTKTAQNVNLGKTYPLIIINDNVTSNY